MRRHASSPRSNRERLPHRRPLASLKQIGRAAIHQTPGVFSLSLISIFLAGCAGGTSGTSGVANFFGAKSPPPESTAAVAASPAPASSASPVAQRTTGRTAKKTVQQARAASENAAAASKEAAIASATAAKASKQAASVANQIDGHGPTNADVSLENNPSASAQDSPAFAAGTRATVSSSAVIPSIDTVASAARATAAVNPPTLDAPVIPDQGDPAKASRLIQDVDRIERRIDRNRLSADDLQRDLMAQKLIAEAKEALAERDSVAATSLATKASTLLAPLPRLADSGR